MKTRYKIGILLLFVAVAAVLGCIGPSQLQSNQEADIATTPTSVSTANNTNLAASPQSTTTIKCELCHTNANDLNPHVNGGKLCINCHGSQVHNIHVGENTVNLQCDSCHGFPPKVPKVQQGEGPGHYSVCEQCHAPPPNSLNASNGHLVAIHLSRSKYCTNCHGNDIQRIHATALANANK